MGIFRLPLQPHSKKGCRVSYPILGTSRQALSPSQQSQHCYAAWERHSACSFECCSRARISSLTLKTQGSALPSAVSGEGWRDRVGITHSLTSLSGR